MLPAMFPSLRLSDPRSQKKVRIGKMSYVWAGLFGPFFVLVKAGPVRALLSLGLTLACAIGLFGFVANIQYVPPTMRPIALLVAVPGVLLFHAMQTVALVTNYYRQRRWVVRQE
jgi:hypothetical protein